MKTILFLLSLLYSVSSFSAEVDVLSAEFGVEDESGKPQLCLTVVRLPKTGAVVGIVETLYDCFFTRQAKKNPRIDINLKTLTRPDSGLLQHLQSRDASLEFLFSDGE